jgi:hypothetical protein
LVARVTWLEPANQKRRGGIYMQLLYVLIMTTQPAHALGALLAITTAHGVSALPAAVLLQVGPEQAICNMINAIKAWTGILVLAAAIAIGFALILRGLAPEFSNQFQGAIRSVIVGLIVIAVLPLVATFILTSLGATGTGSGCA